MNFLVFFYFLLISFLLLLILYQVTQRQAQARMMQNAPPILPATPTKTITTSAENKPHSVIMEAKFANNNCRLNGLRTDISVS